MIFLPSALTLFNLFLGVVSLMFTFNHELMIAAVFILIAGIIDTMDGRVARKFNVSSDFGKELDSLADLVSFGVAPAFLVYGLMDAMGISGIQDVLTIALTIIFVLCGAYRLARFNVLHIADYFVGVPITFGGGLVALAVLLFNSANAWFFILLMFIISFLMISKIKVPKFTPGQRK